MSTVNVLYFARLRDELGVEKETVDLPNSPCSVTELKSALAERGDQWQSAMGSDSLLVAVNQQIAGADAEIQNGDEVGFFPPVTGG